MSITQWIQIRTAVFADMSVAKSILSDVSMFVDIDTELIGGVIPLRQCWYWYMLVMVLRGIMIYVHA